VRHQRAVSHWSIGSMEALSDYAIVTGAAAHPQDYAQLTLHYPDRWISTWQSRDGLSVLPEGLARYITVAATTELERNGKRVRIPELSAVAPNVRRPPLPSGRTLFTDDDTVPKTPAWWYALPILPRHTGAVFMPRVNDGPPRAFLNSASEPVLIDTNFSTFATGNGQFPAEALFALLNSLWTTAALEASTTPMGGGALKVEATHLRVLPLPSLSNEDTIKLATLGRRLSKLPRTPEPLDVLRAIDQVVAGRVANVLNLDKHRVLGALNAVCEALRAQRRR
jgi:hypothetical protein